MGMSKGVKPSPEELQLLVDAVVLQAVDRVKTGLAFYYLGSKVTEEELGSALSRAWGKMADQEFVGSGR